MKESKTLANNVEKNFHQREMFWNTKGQCIKESNTLVDNAANNLLRIEVLLNTKVQYMKESNTLVGNAANNFPRGEILLNTKGQYMKESNILVGYAANNFLRRVILQDTKSLYIKANRNWKGQTGWCWGVSRSFYFFCCKWKVLIFSQNYKMILLGFVNWNSKFERDANGLGLVRWDMPIYCQLF